MQVFGRLNRLSFFVGLLFHIPSHISLTLGSGGCSLLLPFCCAIMISSDVNTKGTFECLIAKLKNDWESN